MKRLVLAAAAACVLMTGPAAASSRTVRLGCHRTYTVAMAERAARVIFAGTRRVSLREFRHLGWYERCQRSRSGQAIARAYDRRARAAHAARLAPPAPAWSYGVASWYQDGGQTASGWHASYGVANLSLAFGTRVEFSYRGRTVVATVDDRGPYVGGREWDLSQSTAGALGFDGVATVGYRLLR